MRSTAVVWYYLQNIHLAKNLDAVIYWVKNLATK
jgi:hypothetical protein